MKNIIKLTESDISKMVNEVLSELDYSTYKSAYDKMREKGQGNRAANLNQGVNQVYGQSSNREATPDDPSQDDITYNLGGDSMTIASPIQQRTSIFTRDGERSQNNSLINNPNNLRTSHRKVANNRAKAYDWYKGGAPKDGHRTVDDFIAETVNRIINKLKK